MDCVCPVGFRGNPYVECTDVNECIGNACGMNAACINTIGSYDCKCQAGFSGNPFQMCMPVQQPLDPGCAENPELCGCSLDTDCQPGFVCNRGLCKDSCSAINCGPNAACDQGKCKCVQGFLGNPADVSVGCKSSSCTNNFDCKDNEICFSISRRRTCVDACTKVQCGPNAFCVAQDHRSSCLCQPGNVGNPSDTASGCQPEDREGQCTKDSDCGQGKLCQVDAQGNTGCVDPCFNHVCGQNEICFVENKRPLCRCQDNYLRNPINNICQSK